MATSAKARQAKAAALIERDGAEKAYEDAINRFRRTRNRTMRTEPARLAYTIALQGKLAVIDAEVARLAMARAKKLPVETEK